MVTCRKLLGIATTYLMVMVCDSNLFLNKSRSYPFQVHQMVKAKLSKENPKTMGVWSPWSDWTSCTRSCGGGITQQTRHCVPKSAVLKLKDIFYKKHRRKRTKHPKAANHCIGLYKRVRLCNTQDCSTGRDFRAEQCTEFNNRPFKGKMYAWEPYTKAIDECSLNCMAIGGGFYATLNKLVADGTSCRKPTTSTGKPAPPGTKGICFEGYCKSIGANGIIGAVEDVQEECSSCLKQNCRSITGLYTRTDIPPGYSKVAQIPQGACKVSIQQLKHSRNILALKFLNDSYILNGDWKFSNSIIVKGAGTEFAYNKQDAATLEAITSRGPLQDPVDIMVFYQQPNPGIKYGYSLPVDTKPGHDQNYGKPLQSLAEPRLLETSINSLSQRDEPKPAVHPHRRTRLRKKFIWKITGVSACSKTCGGGIQQSIYSCVREHSQTQVYERRCSHIEKPATHPIRCNSQECPHWGGHWDVCSGTCGEGIQNYKVQCMQENSGRVSVLSESACAQPKPTASSRTCYLLPCESISDNELHQNPSRVIPYSTSEWQIGKWSTCSVSCGTGTRSRLVNCPLSNCNEKRPTHSEYCENTPCTPHEHASSWLLSDWSSCTESCGTGVQSRFALCSKSYCSNETKPDVMRACSSDKDCGGQWFVGPWNDCSDSCKGPSVQKREVHCVVKLRGQSLITTEMTCPASSKPDTERICEGTCPPVWFTGDWGSCENCPHGVHRRIVKCMTVEGDGSNGCNNENMPLVKRTCACERSDSRERTKPVQDEPVNRNCVDKIRNCYLAVQARLCQYSYYVTHCCVSCRKAQQDSLE